MEAKNKTILGVCIAVVVVAVIAVVLVLTLNRNEPARQVTFTSENAEASISQAFLNGEFVDGKMEAMVFSADSSKNTATTEKLNTWADIDLTFGENSDQITLAFNIFNQNADKELNVKLTYESASESADYTYTVSAGIDATTPSEVASGDTITLNANSAGNGKMVTITVVFNAKEGAENVVVDDFELTVALQSEASESTGGDNTEEEGPLYKVIDNNSNGIVDFGDYIEFGYYPATIKDASVTLSSTTDANGYYTGSDGEKYVAFTSINPSSMTEYSDGTTNADGTTYYFKIEPIVWKVLSVDSNNVVYLFSENVIDAQTGNGGNYAESGISEWLNSEFLNTAFSNGQQAIIQDTTISEVAEDVKVFLMGEDILNADYGFNPVASDFSDGNDVNRAKEGSDYANARCDNIARSPSTYWIRSITLGDTTNQAVQVTSTGRFIHSSAYNQYLGIAPALYIQIDSTTISAETTTE